MPVLDTSSYLVVAGLAYLYHLTHRYIPGWRSVLAFVLYGFFAYPSTWPDMLQMLVYWLSLCAFVYLCVMDIQADIPESQYN
ncbi:hypothetical protein F5Y16DRAFT_398722 [Xylariaceae sp. FL0255]|nr:hypothetical protein F5Y16DRAFT_398722 [Xylariaceae sp. FL0255]